MFDGVQRRREQPIGVVVGRESAMITRSALDRNGTILEHIA